MKKSRIFLIAALPVLLVVLLSAGMFALVSAEFPGNEMALVDQPQWMRAEEKARELMTAMINRTDAGEMSPGAVMTVTTPIPDINPDMLCSLIEAMENANDDAATHTDCPAGA